ncbi:MAG: HAMP domain-containing protein [Verrucomicrobiae bacterium]|nr:HAMP domain-containing protein [Verrucomicrobiae bacterium]
MLRKYDLRLQPLIGIVVASAMVIATTSWSYFLYSRLYSTIVAGYDAKLFAISGVIGSFIDGDKHASVVESRDESSEAYGSLVGPMKQILRKAELTYVYTQVLLDDPECMYVLDATEGEDHTEVGYIDELPPADYAGARKVLQGDIHIGEVQETDNWGMIKVSYAPIVDSQGDISAMAGADVNLSVIKMKTRIALLAAFGLGIIVLSVGIYASVAVAKRLTEPIKVLKEGALKLASGRYNHRIEVEKPQELALLAGTFNRLSDDLVETLESQRCDHLRSRESAERSARMEELAKRCPQSIAENRLSEIAVVSLLEGTAKHGARTCSSWVACGDELILWMVPGVANALQSLERRCAIGDALRQIILHGAEGIDEISTEEISEILQGDAKCFLHYRAGDDSAWVHPFQPISLWLWDGEKMAEQTVSQPGVVPLPKYGGLLFTDAAEPLSDAFQERLVADLAGASLKGEAVQRLVALLQQVSVTQETLVGGLFPSSVEPPVTSR